MDDQEAMRVALSCAHSVEGRTSPRPPVGAVVVREGVIVGQGATSPPYGPHAEVHALRQAGELAQGATLYATLEPCSVTIHTPPCTQAIIQAGIQRVVVATLDSNPLVYRNGIAQLQEAGIEVVVGMGEEEAQELLRPFAYYITRGRPYVTAKWAMTLDGKIATASGDAYWISNERSRVWVHNLRERVDAIMVGARTARADNPRLTVRLSDEEREYRRAERSGPLRVILSARGDLPDTLNLFQAGQMGQTCLIVGGECSERRVEGWQGLGIEVVQVESDEQGRVSVQSALTALAQRGIMHVLVEGGASLLGEFLDQRLIDYAVVFVAPRLIGGSNALTPIGGRGIERMRDAIRLKDVRHHLFDGDVLIEGEVEYQ